MACSIKAGSTESTAKASTRCRRAVCCKSKLFNSKEHSVPKRKSGVMKDNPESAAVAKAEARYQVILNDMHKTGSVSVDALA